MDAIRLKIEAQCDKNITLDKLIVKKGEEKIPLVFKRTRTIRNENEIIIEGSRPSGHTMISLGENTYDAINEITGIHRMKFRGDDGALAAPVVKRILIIFPNKKNREVCIYEKN